MEATRQSPLRRLAELTDRDFPNLFAARERTASGLRKRREDLGRLRHGARTSIVLMGSWGRAEVTTGSDDDFMVLVQGGKRFMVKPSRRAVKRVLDRPPGRQGVFGAPVFSERLVNDIGLDRDDNKNLTRRMLFLLESTAVSGDEVYRSVRAEVLDRYLDESVKPYRPPRFLFNDLVRYWRTICVDFAGKEREGPEKWGLRNAKLRTSRKVLFAGGLIPVLECFRFAREPMREFIEEQLDMPPTDRIAQAFLENDATDEGGRALGFGVPPAATLWRMTAPQAPFSRAPAGVDRQANGEGESTPCEGHDVMGEGSGWLATLKRTATEFRDDNLSDWAAALTYYGLLSLFPALLAMVSLVGLFGDPESTTEAVTEMVTAIGPESAAETFAGPIESITSNRGAAGLTLIVGLATALWSASAYVGAFMRASNVIYETPEGRPFWKLRPLQLVVTLTMIVLVALVALGLVLTGPIVEAVADPIGVSGVAVDVWNIAKWPVLAALFITVLAVLYYASPNAKLRGFKWVTPGSIVALVAWAAASAAFAIYVANFGSYDKTYGALGGMIALLVWFWITNLAILFGHQLNAERERSREIEEGRPGAEDELQLEPRDEPKQPQTRGGQP